MKRLVAALLWAYAVWIVGSFTAFVMNVPDLLGPVLGIATGLIVGVDPRNLIWFRDSAKLATGPTSSTASSAA